MQKRVIIFTPQNLSGLIFSTENVTSGSFPALSVIRHPDHVNFPATLGREPLSQEEAG